MAKKKKDEGEELWPGAGLRLNLENIESDDADYMEKIDEHIAGLPTTWERILWLERFLIEYTDIIMRDAPGRIVEILDLTLANDPTHEDVSHQFWSAVNNLKSLIERRLQKQKDIHALEQKASGIPRFSFDFLRSSERERSRGAESMADSVPAEDLADDPVPGRWTNEQAAVALYALLRAAGLTEKHNKSAVARFAHLLTGRSQDKMKKAGYEAAGGTFDDAGAKAVIEQFEQLGLGKLAAAIRDKDFTKL